MKTNVCMLKQMPSSTRKVSRFNTRAEVWMEDGLVLMKFTDEADGEHLFHRGRNRMELRRSMGADQQDLRVEILRGPSGPKSAF